LGALFNGAWRIFLLSAEGESEIDVGLSEPSLVWSAIAVLLIMTDTSTIQSVFYSSLEVSLSRIQGKRVRDAIDECLGIAAPNNSTPEPIAFSFGLNLNDSCPECSCQENFAGR